MLDAYASGVNAYLALGLPLPPDLALAEVTPEAWSAADCCAVFLVRHVVFANWQKKLWRGRLVAALGVDDTARIESADRRAVPLIVPPPALVEPAPVDAEQLAAMLPAMARLAETAAGATRGRWTAAGPRRVCRSSPATRIASSRCRASMRSATWRATTSMRSGSPSSVSRASRTSATPPTWRGASRTRTATTRISTSRIPPRAPARRRETRSSTSAVAIRCISSATPRRGVRSCSAIPSRGAVVSLRSTALADPSTGFTVLVPMLRARHVDELDDVMHAWVIR